jgi:hypothetical protein
MKSNLLHLMFLIIIFTGCEDIEIGNNSNDDRIDCDGFTYDFDFWKKINEQDSIKFISNDNDEINFIRFDSHITEPYTASANPPILNGGYGCHPTSARFNYTCDELGIIDLMIRFFEIDTNGQTTDKRISFTLASKESIGYLSYTHVEIEPGLIPSDSFESTQTVYDSLSINNSIYHDCIQIEKDTTGDFINNFLNFPIWKLVVSRGKGIVYLADLNGKEYFLRKQ